MRSWVHGTAVLRSDVGLKVLKCAGMGATPEVGAEKSVKKSDCLKSYMHRQMAPNMEYLSHSLQPMTTHLNAA